MSDAMNDWIDNFYMNDYVVRDMLTELRQQIRSGNTDAALETLEDLENKLDLMGALDE